MMFVNFTLLISFLMMTMAVSLSSQEKMNNYMKRTGTKYLDEKAKEDGVYKLKSGKQFRIQLYHSTFLH